MSDEVCPFCRGDVRNRVCVLCGAEYVAAQHWNRRVETPIRWRPPSQKPETFPIIALYHNPMPEIFCWTTNPTAAEWKNIVGWIPFPEPAEGLDPFEGWADEFVARAGRIDKAWLRKLWDAAQAAKETAK